MLTKEFLTVQKIAIKRNTSQQAVYKIINKLRKKGYLKGGLNKGLKKVRHITNTGVDRKQYARLHGLQLNIKIIHKSQYYDNLREKSNVMRLEDATITLHKESINIYSSDNLEFGAQNSNRAISKALNHFIDLIHSLEQKLHCMLIKIGYSNIDIVDGEISEVNNEIATKYHIEKKKLKIRGTDDGKVWAEVDFSKQCSFCSKL